LISPLIIDDDIDAATPPLIIDASAIIAISLRYYY
jgi:hypothetical protein